MEKINNGQNNGFLQPEDTERSFTFSVYKKPISNKIPLKEVTLKDVFKVISSEKYKDITFQLRKLLATDDEDGYRREKSKKLDHVTFSGTFEERAASKLKKHSGLICIDLDDLNDIEKLKQQILENGIQPALLFTSPSERGLKVIYRIDIHSCDHLSYFNAFESFFQKELSISIDRQCKDVSRTCFLCYDPEAYLNENADVVGKELIDTFQPIDKEIQRNQNVTDVITDHDVIMTNLKTWLDKKLTFGKSCRNEYIVKLSNGYNRFGIPEGEALSDLLSYAESGFTEDEISRTVKSVYKHTERFGTERFERNRQYSFNDKITVKEDKKSSKITPFLPIDGFPDVLQSFIKEYTEVYKVPQDYIAASVFFATALAIGDKLELITRYKNLPILWMALVGFVSDGKTQPLNTSLSFFTEKDRESFSMYKEQLKLWKAYEKLTKKQKENVDEVPEPTFFQYILNDYTMESLYRAHDVNKRGICIMRDELKGWIDDFGRYNKSGEQSAMLSTFSRVPMHINRAGSEPIIISDPVIYVTGGIQPDLLPDLAKDKRAESGFLARFLFVYPDWIGKQPYNDNRLSKKSSKELYDFLDGFLQIPERVELSLSEEAKKMFAEWYNRNSEMTNKEDTGYLKGVYGKFDYYVLRFCVVFRGMNMVCNGDASVEVSADEMKASINLIEYFRATALKVYDKIFGNKSKKVSKKEMIKILSELGASQNEVAAAVKVSQPYVNKVLNKG